MGDHSQVLKVSKGTCTGQILWGVGGPIPGSQGVSRDMYGTAYVPTYYKVNNKIPDQLYKSIFQIKTYLGFFHYIYIYLPDLPISVGFGAAIPFKPH